MLPLLTLILEVLNLSMHYLISIWTTLMKFEQNRMEENVQIF